MWPVHDAVSLCILASLMVHHLKWGYQIVTPLYYKETLNITVFRPWTYSYLNKDGEEMFLRNLERHGSKFAETLGNVYTYRLRED